MRIDKWLWVVRIYKTRTLASAACDQGKVLLLGHSVKPSRLIQTGDEIHIKRTGLVIKLKVLRLSQNRLNPKLVSEYAVDVTPQEEIDAYKARLSRVTVYRDPGTGRPTKRERRILDDFMDTDDS